MKLKTIVFKPYLGNIKGGLFLSLYICISALSLVEAEGQCWVVWYYHKALHIRILALSLLEVKGQFWEGKYNYKDLLICISTSSSLGAGGWKDHKVVFMFFSVSSLLRRMIKSSIFLYLYFSLELAGGSRMLRRMTRS